MTATVLTSDSLSSKSRDCRSFGWFENPLATRLCAHVLAELADSVQALRNPALEKVAKRPTWQNRESLSEKRSSVEDKTADDELCAEVALLTFLLMTSCGPCHVPEVLDDRILVLEKVAKKVDRQVESPLVEEMYSGQAKWKTEIFGQSRSSSRSRRT